jgi:hypothetical protein
MIKILIETIAEVVAKNQSQTEEILKWIKEQPEQSEPLQKISNRLEAIDVNVRNVPNKVSMPLAEIIALKRELRAHIEQLAIPLKKEVKHEHHVLASIAGLGVSFLIIMGLSFLSYYGWMQADLHRENDIKYRYLQGFLESEGQKSLHNLDSQYTSNPDEFRKTVLQREKIQKDSFEDFKQMQEKQQQIKDLREKWNRPPGRKFN